MKKSLSFILILCVLLGGGFAIWWLTKPKLNEETAQPRSQKGPIPVQAVPASIQAMPIILDAIGTVESEQSVAIHTEVSGTLQQVFFKEGEPVKAEQLLFQIDPKTLSAQADRAKATVARDQAQATQAKAKEQRLASLVGKEYITRQEYEQALAEARASGASVNASQAELKQAMLQLARTRIYSPINGRAGALNIKPGNLVTANGQTPLVTINATQPVLVTFSIPQQQLVEVRRYQALGEIRADVQREKGESAVAQGKLAFIDNTIDPANGTIKLKIRVANEHEAIWPGELVSIRLTLAIQPDALVVPESAVQIGQHGPFVYVIDQDKAVMQPIKIARQIDSRVVVASGLKPGQRVITTIPQTLRPGSQVQVMQREKSRAKPQHTSKAKTSAAQGNAV